MTRAQWVVLSWLEIKPGITQVELADLVEVEPITVARLIDRLEGCGLVERRADPKDRRVRRLVLTEKALPLLDEIQDYRAELLELISADLPAGALEELRATLLTIKAKLARDATPLEQAV